MDIDKVELTKTIANNIKKIRKAKKLKQNEVCNRIGMKTQQFSDIENAKNLPQIDTLIKIAYGLDVNLLSLLDNDESPESQLIYGLNDLDEAEIEFMKTTLDNLIKLRENRTN